MKQYIISGIALLALMLPSCSEDNLEIPQKGVVDYDSFYSDPKNAENAATFVYQTGSYAHWCGAGSGDWIWQGALYVLQEACADEIYWASGHAGDHVSGLYMNGYWPGYDENNVTQKVGYTALYNMNRGANLLLDNYSIDMVKDDENLNAIVNRSVAEAKVARAYAHFLLAICWGNPPLVDHQLSPSDRPGNTPHEEILAFCINELEEASQYLPSKSKLEDPNMTVRYTKEFALALKGKVQMFAGDYAGAKESLKAVINSKLYDLVDGQDMHKIYHVAGDCSKEWLFQYNFIDSPGNIDYFDGQYSYHFVKSTSWRGVAPPDEMVGGWGSIMPTGKFSEDLIKNDGMDSWRRQSWIVTYDELLNGKVIGKDTVISYANTAYVVRGIDKDGVYGCEGYWAYKRIPLFEELVEKDKGGTNTGSQVNYPVMRYAEVLLLYAEACAMTDDNDGSGLEALQKIQERAGSEHHSDKLTLDEVKNEKRFECFLEGSRFFDLVRWGDAYETMKDQGKRIPKAWDDASIPVSKEDKKKGITNPYYLKEHHFRIEWEDHSEAGFVQGKHELMPYPYVEISVNPNIVQNPGY